jgi:predicted DNA-binding transcriptional regulator AlpA
MMTDALRQHIYDASMAEGRPIEDYLTLEQVAERAGWSLKTARTMQHRANRRRAAGEPRPGDLPEPDHRFGRTPVWLDESIEQWLHSRPGQGVGGGPKPRQ